MRVLVAALFITLMLGGYASALDQSNPAIAPDSQIVLAKLIKKRVCPKDEIRCACADTGTSACCKADQNCNCDPTARCTK